MSRKRTAEEASALRITMAARDGKPFKAIGGIDATETLHIPVTREVRLPEPVTWRGLNGREPEAWEEPLIVAARERGRRLEAALLAGTLGQP